MATENDSLEFEVVIDFAPGVGDPSRIFKSMSGLIEAIAELDKHLVGTIDTHLSSRLVLESVEAGSLKAKLRSCVKDLPDEALKEGSFGKIIGHFLLKAKYLVLRWTSEKKAIQSREDVKVLEAEILKAAEETDIKQLPAYAPIPMDRLLGDIRNIQEALTYLELDDSAGYRSSAGNAPLNRDLVVSEKIVREVLTREVLSSEGERILKVKKPDYLGQSMWSFRYEGHAIDAAINDVPWLGRFQAREVDLRPGDSLKVHLREEVYYGFENEVVHKHYEVARVIDVIRGRSLEQNELFEQ